MGKLEGQIALIIGGNGGIGLDWTSPACLFVKGQWSVVCQLWLSRLPTKRQLPTYVAVTPSCTSGWLSACENGDQNHGSRSRIDSFIDLAARVGSKYSRM
jgi:hypothetical protein